MAHSSLVLCWLEWGLLAVRFRYERSGPNLTGKNPIQANRRLEWATQSVLVVKIFVR